MATQKGDIVERAVNAALADIEKYAPEEFQQLQADPEKKQALVQAAREAAEEEVKLAEEFRAPAQSTGDHESIAKSLSKHLPSERVELIRTGLQVPTYQLNISKKPDGAHWVDITRDGKPFMESKKLDTAEAIDAASNTQIASIIVEAVLLTLQAVGIKVPITAQIIAKVAAEIVPLIGSSSQLKEAVEALKIAVQSGVALDIAKAIFYLIKEAYSSGILWKIIKGLCSNMSKWDWIKAAGVVTAQIVAALATDGVALIAKIVLAINKAYNFIQKVKNLEELAALKNEL